MVRGQAYRDNSRAASDGSLLAIAQPRNHAIVVFDSRPTPPRPMFAFGRYGRQAGEFIRPTGIAISAGRGMLYVSDTDNDRVEVFRLGTGSDGQVRSATFAKAIGRRGGQPGEFAQPAGLALDEEGSLYVCDTGNARVQVFDAQLAFARQWGGAGRGEGKFDAPISAAIEPGGGVVYVSDIGHLDVQAFDRTGQPLFAWGAPLHPEKGVSPGEFAYPFGLALAPGLLFVSDSRRHDVQKFRGKALVGKWGSAGNEDGHFFQPEDVAVIDAQRVVVIDQGGTRGQVFSPDGVLLASFPIPAGDLFAAATPPSS